jgi:hypothetical protein
VRKAARGNADSSTLLATSRILGSTRPQAEQRYGGLGADRPVASTRATSALAPQLTGAGPLPLPGQSPGLSRVQTTGQEPVAETRGGKTQAQFFWDHLLEGTKSLSQSIDKAKGELMEAGRTAFEEPEKFDPSAPTKAAWNVMTGGMGMAERGALGYGQKFKGASVRGESKSHADHLDDLVREKAAHMRMTAQELEKRLRGGDASLLGIMLGAPTIAAAYRYWDAGRNAPASSVDSRASSSPLAQ